MSCTIDGAAMLVMVESIRSRTSAISTIARMARSRAGSGPPPGGGWVVVVAVAGPLLVSFMVIPRVRRNVSLLRLSSRLLARHGAAAYRGVAAMPAMTAW